MTSHANDLFLLLVRAAACIKICVCERERERAFARARVHNGCMRQKGAPHKRDPGTWLDTDTLLPKTRAIHPRSHEPRCLEIHPSDWREKTVAMSDL